MVKLLALLASCGILSLVHAAPVAAVDAEPGHVVIAWLQPESVASATEERIDLYNPTATEVDMTGWRIEYRSAASTDDKKWTIKATLACKAPSAVDCKVVVPSYGSLTLASYAVEGEYLELTSGMALAGGQVRLVQPGAPSAADEVHDMVGYGAAVVAEGEAAVAPQKGKAILRKTEKQNGKDVPVDSDNNKSDFILEEEAAPEEEPGKGGKEPTYLPLLITEILPDPASPAEDDKDEFIELYNPHDQPVTVRDYVLEAGTNWRYKFILPDVVLPPHSYLVFTAEQTGITLSNSGTNVRLLDPTEKVIDEAQPYGAAKTGQSWIRLDQGGWQWTLEPTPGAANILHEEPPKVVASSPAPKAPKATKKAAAATPKPKKPAAVKAAKPKAQKPEIAAPAEQVAQTKSTPNYWLIGTVVAMAGGYALYEYRHDARNMLRRIREAKKAK